MRVQSFLGKVSIDGLHQMDEHINHWFEQHEIKPQHVTQSFGYEEHEGGVKEPVILTLVWY